MIQTSTYTSPSPIHMRLRERPIEPWSRFLSQIQSNPANQAILNQYSSQSLQTREEILEAFDEIFLELLLANAEDVSLQPLGLAFLHDILLNERAANEHLNDILAKKEAEEKKFNRAEALLKQKGGMQKKLLQQKRATNDAQDEEIQALTSQCKTLREEIKELHEEEEQLIEELEAQRKRQAAELAFLEAWIAKHNNAKGGT